MAEDDLEFENEGVDAIENGRAIHAVLTEWASSGVRLAYTLGPYGIDIEGTITHVGKLEDGPSGVFKASFLFTSTAPGMRAHILMDPGMALRRMAGADPLVEFGPAGFCSLRPINTRGSDRHNLEGAVRQLRHWATCKAEIWAFLNLGHSAMAALCRISVINDHSFALLTEDSRRQFIFTTPRLSSHISIEQVPIVDHQPITCVRLISDDGRTELSMYDAAINREDFLRQLFCNTPF